MGVDMKVKAIYDSEIGNITRSEKNWKDVLKVAGQLYRYEFDNIVMVTAQRPPEKSTLMADYDTWKKVGRYVMDCQHFFRQIFLGYFSDIVQAFDTLRKNVCGDDYTSLHNPIVLSSVLPAYGMFHSIQILFL